VLWRHTSISEIVYLKRTNNPTQSHLKYLQIVIAFNYLCNSTAKTPRLIDVDSSNEQENLKKLKYFMSSQSFRKETRSNLGFILSVDSKSMSKSTGSPSEGIDFIGRQSY